VAQQPSPLVYIVVLNWNGWHDTIPCIESLRQLSYPSYHIVVVDNASSDGSEERIRAACPDITVLQSGANLGFAGGNNVGIRYALEQGADYVWLLNNDAFALPDSLSPLVQRAESDPQIGFVGSKILYASQPDVVWFAGGAILPRNARGAYISGVPNDDRLPPAHEPGYLAGTSLLARDAAIRHIGLVPECYFLYYEEVDWQYTGRRAGWKLMYEPASVVLHKVSRTVVLDSPIQAFHNARSRMIFVRRHMPRARYGALLDVLYFDAVLRARRWRWKAAFASCRGMIAGLRAPSHWSGEDAARIMLPPLSLPTAGMDHRLLPGSERPATSE
jgi:GT2 family glycosyltransferase